VPQDNVIKLSQPGLFDDQLTEILRNGARALLAKVPVSSTSMILRRRPSNDACAHRRQRPWPTSQNATVHRIPAFTCFYLLSKNDRDPRRSLTADNPGNVNAYFPKRLGLHEQT